MKLILGAALVLLALVGCAAPAAPPAAVETPSPTATVEAPVTAEGVAEKLQAAIPSITSFVVIDETNDPNQLFGRPNGYIGAAVIYDSRATPCPELGVICGATVELWSNDRDALGRSDYILDLLKNSPMFGTEYNYLDGPILLRVSGELPPSAATEYEAALGG